MILHRGAFIGPLQGLKLGSHVIKWISNSRLLGVTIDDRLNWSKHVTEVKKGFVNKLNMLKRSRFLPKSMLLDLYFRIIIPSVTYALPVWGGLTNKEGFEALEALHCRAARIIFELPWDMPKVDVMDKVKWPSLSSMYKKSLAKLMYKVYNNMTPEAMLGIIDNNNHRNKRHQLRHQLKLNVPRFSTYYMRNSIARRGALVWNSLVPEINDNIDNVKKFAKMASKSKSLKNLDFNCISPQTLNYMDEDFKYN